MEFENEKPQENGGREGYRGDSESREAKRRDGEGTYRPRTAKFTPRIVRSSEADENMHTPREARPERDRSEMRDDRRSGGDKPFWENRPRRDERSSNDRPAREDRPFERRERFGDRGDRPARDFRGGDRPFRDRNSDSNDRPFRGERNSSNNDRPFRGDRDASRGDRPFRGGDRDNSRGRDGVTPNGVVKPFRGGDRDASRGERPFRGGDRDASRGNRPFRGGDRDASRGDRPFRGGDRDASRGDRPFRGGDRDASRGDRPFRGGDRNATRGDRPFRGGDRNASGSDRGSSRFARPQRENWDDVEGGELRGFRSNRKHIQVYEPKQVNDDPNKPIRLNRFIANAGICSRREADTYIQAGVVSINGVIVNELGTKVNPTDEVRFNDEPIRGEKKVYILLNKPKDYITTVDDPHAKQTVMELVAEMCKERIYPVGRLDRNTTGVLLLTNDGDLATKLLHPSANKKKIYHVHLSKKVSNGDLEKLCDGVMLEDGRAWADVASYVDGDQKQVGVEIHSGKNRIVRRMFEALGYEIEKLDRVYFSGLTKKGLARGEARFLDEKEVEMLRRGAYE